MAKFRKELPEELDIGDEMEDVASTRHKPRPSVFATFLPTSNPSSSKKLSHIYVRNQFNRKPDSLRPFLSHRVSPSASTRQVYHSPTHCNTSNISQRIDKTSCEKSYAISKANPVKINAKVLAEMEDKVKDCTFSPAINERRDPRNFTEFIKDQEKKRHLKERTLKDMIVEKRKAEAAELQKGPRINESSRQLATKIKDKGPVHDRLHATIEKQTETVDTNCTFKPKLSLNSIKLAAYAKKHHQKTRSEIPSPQNSAVMHDISGFQHFTTSVSPRSSSILQKKYGRELEEAMAKWDHDTLVYNEMAEVLEGLSCLKDPGTRSELASDLWKLVNGEEKAGISKQVLTITMLSIILGQNGQGNDSKENSKISLSYLKPAGKCNEKGSLSEIDISYLRKKYAPKIVSNLLCSRRSSNPDLSVTANFTFTPHINSRSNTLANAIKQKAIYGATQESKASEKLSRHVHNASIPDITVYRSTVDDFVEKEKREKDQKERKECTFFPKTNSKPLSRRTSPKEATLRALKHTEQLHELGKSGTKEDITTDEYKFVKEKNQYTFKPNLKATSNGRLRQGGNSKKVRGEDRSVERIAQGRKEKERVNGILNEGYWNYVQKKNAMKAEAVGKKPAKKVWEDSTGGEERIMKKVYHFLNNRKYSAKPNALAVSKPHSKKPSVTTIPSPKAATIPPIVQKELEEEPLMPPTINLSPTAVEQPIEEEQPMLFLELNIGKGITERVLMYENEDPEGIIEMVSAKHNLNEAAREKLTMIIMNQLQSIQEEAYEE